MRVNDIKASLGDVARNRINEEKSDLVNMEKVFKRELFAASGEKHFMHIEALIDEITKQGKIVSQKADMAELAKYRQLITELLNENAGNSFQYVKSDKFDARGRHKVFAIIKNINKKLDDLTTKMLEEQSNNIDLLKITDDIRGLLVDLFL